jgi:peptidyl-prolyl cis-trans isomerase SurA
MKVVTMLKKSSLLAFVALFFAVALHADNIVDEIVARIGDSIITKADFDKGKKASEEDLKQRYPSDWQQKWTDREKDVLRDLIDQQLLLEKGKELGITAETETTKRLNEIRLQMGLSTMEDMEKAANQQGVSYEDFKDQIRNGIITQQVIGREVGSRIHITTEEIQAWYNEHQKELESEEMVKLSEILVSTQPPKPPASDQDKDKDKDKAAEQPAPEDPAKVAAAEAKAKELVAELRNGANFQDLAKKNSDGPTAADGGEIGAFKHGELAKELEDKTFSLKSGEITDAVRTKQGFLILKVVEHRPAGIPPVKEVEDKIREAIYVKKLEPALRTYLTKLREESYIDIHAGFADSGASPNQSKPIVMTAANTGAPTVKDSKVKKKKKLGVF